MEWSVSLPERRPEEEPEAMPSSWAEAFSLVALVAEEAVPVLQVRHLKQERLEEEGYQSHPMVPAPVCSRTLRRTTSIRLLARE